MNRQVNLPLQFFVFALSVLLLNSRSTAASTDLQLSELSGEDYYFDQVPVVLSATRLAQPQYEAPVAVSVIDRAMIEASGALDIPDLLRMVPGFQVGRSRGHTVSATYHGLADEHARRMQVLVDGRPVYGPALGGVRWTDLPLDIKDIERIEVVRGPNAAAFGSNAFLGAINIITQHPSQVDGTELSWVEGNKGSRKGLLRHGGRQGKFDYRMSLGYRRDEGFKSRTDLGPPDPVRGSVFARDPLNDGMRVAQFSFRGDYQLSNTDSLEMMAGYNGGERGEGRFDDPFDANRDRDVQNHFQQLVWKRSLSTDEELRIQFYHNYMRHREIVSSPMPLFRDINYGTFEERYEVEAQDSRRIDQHLRLVWGGSARLDRVGGDDWFNRTDLIENQLYRLFGNFEWRPYTKGTINIGTMIEYGSQIGSQISPRLAINHQVNEHHGLRASISRASRLPTIYEEKVDGGIRFQDRTAFDQVYLGNTELEPEQISSYEIGYFGRFLDEEVTLDVKLFHDSLKDRINAPKAYPYPDPLNDPGTLYYINTGKLITNGIEATLDYRPVKRSMLRFNWAYAKAKGTAIDSFEDTMGTDPNLLTYEDLSENVPRHTYSVFAMHRLPGQIDISALYYKVSRMKWLGDGDRLGPQDRLDLRVAKHLRRNGIRSSVAFVVQNALGEYLEFRDENVFDTRAYVELTVGIP